MNYMNQICKNFTRMNLEELSSCSDGKYTIWFYVAQVVFACISAIVTFAKYNSINLLNLSIHIDAISNTWWIVYFVAGAIRAIVNSVKYGLPKQEPTSNEIESLITADWSMKAFEVLILCFALNYQRKYRSTAKINEEIDKYSKIAKRKKRAPYFRYLKKALVSSGTVLCALALITWVTIFLLHLFKNKSDQINGYFWVYVGSSSALHVAAVFLTIFILTSSTSEGPTITAKILILVAVLLALPADIPVFIWRNCVYRDYNCLFYHVSLFDLFISLKAVSYVFFVSAMILEYKRLEQECQWAMLNEVQRFSF